MTLGETVALTSCVAWRLPSNELTVVSGLWVLEDRVFPDRSCGQHEPGFILVPKRENHEGNLPEVFIDLDTLREQVHPQSYGRQLADERRADIAAEYESSAH